MANKRLIVIGGGAAGFFCAVNAARLSPQMEVIILEKSAKLLSKVKISGGGRCNVTHACFDVVEMSRQYPRGGNFVKKAFHQFFITDTVNWFEERGVKIKAEADGRMFPVSDSSQTIIDCLLKEANRYRVEVRMNAEVRSLKYEQEKFSVELSDLRLLTSDYVCVACGGYPKSSMFEWLTQTGHSIEEPVPSLFTFNLASAHKGMPGHPITKLMGVSVDNAKVKITGASLEQTGPLLITHWGLSGPAILKLSAWGAKQLSVGKWQFSVLINWLPEHNEQSLQSEFQQLRYDLASQKISGKNPLGLPQRLWDFFLQESSVRENIRWADLNSKEQNKLVQIVCSYRADVKGKTTFKEEFVTAGGIKLNEVDVNTMMSKKVPGLFFAGEILDVDGVTGGFNFQNAWTSGYIAAKAISASAS